MLSVIHIFYVLILIKNSGIDAWDSGTQDFGCIFYSMNRCSLFLILYRNWVIILINLTKIYVNLLRLKTQRCPFVGMFSLCLLLLLQGQKSFGQRVYANAGQSSSAVTVPVLGTILANVDNPSYSYDSNLSNFSSLNVLVALLNINTARQNLQYTNSIKPVPGSPVYMKIEANSGLTVLSLLTSIRMVRTLGGINNEVGPSYNSNQFLNLLGLLPSGSSTYLVTPLDNTAYFDGLKLINGAGVVAVASTAKLYYSFFIATPNISADTQTLCQNALASTLSLSLANTGENGITYYLFKDTAGLHYKPNAVLTPSAAAGYVGTFTNHQITVSNPFLNAGTGDKTQKYLIIAKDAANSPALFYSAWKEIAFKRTILPTPASPTATIQ